MVGTSSSSSSSCASFNSFDDVTVKASGTVKFLCSYGGKILPRYPDGKLRYIGGHTRVLAVERSLSFSELQVKLEELCGWGMVSLRCQLPTEDLDALVSVTSDEDLANLFEEYDLASRDRLLPLKIRAFLFTPRPPSAKSPSKSPSPPFTPTSAARRPIVDRCVHQIAAGALPARFPGRDPRFHGRHHHGHGGPRPHQFLVHHGNHWQQ